MEPTTWIRVSQAAHELGLSSQAVRNLIHSKKLQGRKGEDGRWVLRATSVGDYLDAHGRRRAFNDDLTQLQRRVEEIARAVEAVRDAGPISLQLESADRERDRYRAEAVSARETAILALASAEGIDKTTRDLLDVMRVQRDALRQQLLPDTLEQLHAPTTHES